MSIPEQQLTAMLNSGEKTAVQRIASHDHATVDGRPFYTSKVRLHVAIDAASISELDRIIRVAIARKTQLCKVRTKVANVAFFRDKLRKLWASEYLQDFETFQEFLQWAVNEGLL